VANLKPYELFTPHLFTRQANWFATKRPNELKYDKEVVKSWLLENNIQPSQRAETLTIEDWISLTKNYKSEESKNNYNF